MYDSFRGICATDRFVKDVDSCTSCCLEGVSVQWIADAWSERAELWSQTYQDQSATTISIWRTHFNVKADTSQQLLFTGWPVCHDCLARCLGIGKKRYQNWLHLWQDSKRTLRRVLSGHMARVRASPIRDVFTAYLDLIADVFQFTTKTLPHPITFFNFDIHSLHLVGFGMLGSRQDEMLPALRGQELLLA